VILGGGTGSTIARWTFAGEGRQAAVVERKYIGGSCPNIACLPSKNIIHSAKVARTFAEARNSASPTTASRADDQGAAGS
jgi:pyruvate/2-oxoglutarate dehydrogenase complex dihydrolipoamide dehydrogenase (E3) component